MNSKNTLALWAWIAFGALAVAGVLALLLALSRVPVLGAVFPVDFFYKGLVVHVIFSLVVWLLANIGFHMAHFGLAASAEGGRADILGKIAPWFALAAFPCLILPGFSSAHAQLTNYIPLIDHPLYDLGLALLAAGLLAGALHALANLRGRKIFALAPEKFGPAVMSLLIVLALLTFAIAAVVLLKRGDFVNSREQFNWGGGHILQFANAALLFTNWALLARRVNGRTGDPELFRLGLALLTGFVLPSLAFYIAFDPFSEKFHDAYRLLQFGIAFPTLLVTISLLSGAPAGTLWKPRDLAGLALAASVLLFLVGGLMGWAISGSDTRTPAHYHLMITAVSLSGMGWMLTEGLERLGRAPVPETWTRRFLLLYGGGQLFASIGMFIAGGYGAQRKTPDAVSQLTSVAKAGMAAHGMGALLAVLGGAGVVIIALRALSRKAA